MSRLTASERERLEILAEECGEVVQAAMKVLRHGYDAYNPHEASPLDNRDRLEKEIGDVRAIVQMMVDADDLRMAQIVRWQKDKPGRMAPYLHHQQKASQ